MDKRPEQTAHVNGYGNGLGLCEYVWVHSK